MITTRARLFHSEKILLNTESGALRTSNWANATKVKCLLKQVASDIF